MSHSTAGPDATDLCEHGFYAGECPEDLCLHRREVKNAILGLAGSVTAASDQPQAMTDAELGTLLTAYFDDLLEVAAASIPAERIAELLRPNERGFRMPVRNGRPWFTDAMQCDACGGLVTATSAERQREGEARHQEECSG